LNAHAQPCSSTQFSKTYTFEGSGGGQFFDRIAGTNKFYFGGIRNYNMVMSTADNNGNQLWSKQYKFDQARFYSLTDNATIDSTGNYFINIDANCIGLLDANGDPIIAREMEVPSQNVYGVGMGILPGNKKVILLDDQSSYGRGYMLLCLSEDLTSVIWNKHFSGGEMYFGNLTIYDNKIFVPGSWQNKGTLLCFDGATGNLLLQKTFTVDNKQTSLEKIYPYKDGYIVQAKYYRGDPNHHLIFRLNKNFEVLNLYRFLNIRGDGVIVLAVDSSGSFHGAWASGFGENRFFMSTNDSILWSHANNPYGLTWPRKLLITNEGLVLFSSGSWENVGQGYYSALALIRSDGNGRFANCPSYQKTVQITPINYTTGISTIEAKDTSLITLLPASITTTDNNYDVAQICQATSRCDALKLYGNKFMCNNATAIFTAKRNTGCFTPVNWSITGGKCSYQQLNDSTLSVQFLQPGNYTLKSTLKTCNQIGDSIQVQVALSSQLVDLGSDTTICPGNSLLLNAGAGYSSYLWQDGSTDSTYRAAQTGTYHVTVTDDCGNVGRDSLTLGPQPPISLSVGADRIKCNDDTIHIAAPPGFMNYQWSPDYEISSTTTQHILVNPKTDTFYVLRAEKLPGCFASDTVRITVNKSATIDLGPDLNLCDGNNITFRVYGNFTSYQWNTGDNSNQITVSQPGQYSVVATTDQGCSSHDSIEVLNIVPNPVVNLDQNDNRLCRGSIITLDAGNFSTYLWNNGTTERTLVVKDTGIYSVTVTDFNGCSGSNMVAINTLLDSPADFLPRDTAICSYETIQIKPDKSYESYLWSTNSSSQEISISQAGIYYLEVTDQNNCSGTDTINVRHKDCMKGCYVPGAFTPNGDGKNDRLRPLLFGNVVRYKFTVFNRSGRIVFQTTNPSTTWDGSYTGSQEISNAYVWTCIYQFEGETEQFATGTVIVIR